MSYTESLEQLLIRARENKPAPMAINKLVELAYKSGEHDGWYRALKESDDMVQFYKAELEHVKDILIVYHSCLEEARNALQKSRHHKYCNRNELHHGVMITGITGDCGLDEILTTIHALREKYP